MKTKLNEALQLMREAVPYITSGDSQIGITDALYRSPAQSLREAAARIEAKESFIAKFLQFIRDNTSGS